MNRESPPDAWAEHQQELERRRREEESLLDTDPDYLKWLDELQQENRSGHDQVR